MTEQQVKERQPQGKGKQLTDRSAGTFVRELLNTNLVISFLAIVAALLFGAILIAVADENVQAAAKYFFSRPSDTFAAIWEVVRNAYVALFQSSIFNARGGTLAQKLYPLTQTLTWSTPLIFAGLGLGIGFRAGLFNIGAQGQIILGAIFAGYLGFTFELPALLHILLCVFAAALGGALWGALPGLLKAKAGAHEVIVTIMMNHIATYLLAFVLTTQAFRRPDDPNPRSPFIHESAEYPLLLGSNFNLHAGFLLALAAAVGVWWLMERSTWGFTFKAVGENPRAARTAGMNVPVAFVAVMAISGALAGLAGSSQILGTEHYLTQGIAVSFGFDAITVALLGRSRPMGIVMAGLLFGALRAGAPGMAARSGTPVDVVLVLQAVVVLFIAAPPLVRMIFRLPKPVAAHKAVTSA